LSTLSTLSRLKLNLPKVPDPWLLIYPTEVEGSYPVVVPRADKNGNSFLTLVLGEAEFERDRWMYGQFLALNSLLIL